MAENSSTEKEDKSRRVRSQLAKACFFKDLGKVKQVFKETEVITISYILQSHFGPLHQVIRGSFAPSDVTGIDVMKFLLENGCDINHTDSEGVTPLFLACELGLPQYVKFLLESQANPLHVNNKGYSTLVKTIKVMSINQDNGRWKEILKLILSWCLKISKDRGSGCTEAQYFELCQLMCYGKIEEFKEFVEGCQDVDFKELKFDSPLLIAIHLNKAYLIRVLINKGADVNLKKNRSILHDALKFADSEIIDFLLDQPGIKVDEIAENIDGCEEIGTKNQRTPLMISCHFNQTTTVQRLLDLGADVLKTNDDGCTALHIACLRADLTCIEILLKRINPSVFNKQSLSFLSVACSRANVDIFKILLEYGADLKMVDRFKSNILHYAAVEPDATEILKFLLKTKKLDVNAQDKSGLTPLDKAMKDLCCENVEVLIRHTAEVKLPDRLYNQEEREDVLDHIQNCENCAIAETFWKLKLLGVELNSDYNSIFLVHKFTEMIPIYQMELAELKQIIINSNPKVSLYDFLIMSRKRVSIYSRNQVCQDLFVRYRKNFQTEFKHFGFLLNVKYVNGLKRSKLIEESSETFDCLLGKYIVKIASENVFAYFNNNELKEFIKAKKEISN